MTCFHDGRPLCICEVICDRHEQADMLKNYMQLTVSVPCAGDIAVLQGIHQKMDQVAEKMVSLEGMMKESSSRTVPASEISQEKLDKLYETLNINVSPMDAIGEIEDRLLNAVLPPASTDGIFTW